MEEEEAENEHQFELEGGDSVVKEVADPVVAAAEMLVSGNRGSQRQWQRRGGSQR